MAESWKKRNDDQLVELARELERLLVEGESVEGEPGVGFTEDSISASVHELRDSGVLHADDLGELERVHTALAFLNRVRKNLSGSLSGSNWESNATGADSTRVADASTRIGQSAGDATDSESSSVRNVGPHEQKVDSNEDLPLQLGRFGIERVLGEGGFARVFLAHDPTLDRRVALKILRPQALVSSQAQARFEREAKAAALLSHPNIVPVFETATIGPVHFIASAWCDGPTLRQYIDDLSDPVGQRLGAAIIARLARTLQHAHQRGIVHRDLKPANIMLETQGKPLDESNVVDALRITDFGLAHMADHHDRSLTVDGAIVGTPAYMAPEQARGERHVGGSSDIYSLGVMLYELVTGQLPHQGATHLATLRQVENDEPKAPRKLVAHLSPDLESICLKALRKSPTDRYATAHDLADDLERWLHGRPVSARRITPLRRAVRWAGRNPLVASAFAAAWAAITIGLAIALWQWNVASHNFQQSLAEKHRANAHLERISGIVDQFLDDLEATDPALITSDQRARLAEIRDMQRELVDEEAGSDDVKANRLRAWHRLIRTHMVLGDYQTASAVAREASTWLENSFAFDSPAGSKPKPVFDSELARIAMELMVDQTEVLNRAGHPDRALEWVARARQIMHSHWDLMEPNHQRMYQLLLTIREGLCLGLLNRRDDAFEALKRAAEYGNIMLQTDGIDSDTSLIVAAALNNLAGQYRYRGLPDAASAHFDEALSLLGAPNRDQPEDFRVRRLRAILHSNYSSTLILQGRFDEALFSINLACDELRELVHDLPRDQHLMESWFVAMARKTDLLFELGRVEEAIALSESISERASQYELAATSKGRATLIGISVDTSRALLRQDRYEEATREAKRAVELAEKWFAVAAEDLRGQQASCNAWIQWIHCLSETGQHEQLVDSVGKYYLVSSNLFTLNPGEAFVAHENACFAWVRRMEVRSWRSLKNWDEAVAATHRLLPASIDEEEPLRYVEAATEMNAILEHWQDQMPEPPADFLAARSQAVDWLELAIREQGYNDRERLERGSTFAALREDPQFAKILQNVAD